MDMEQLSEQAGRLQAHADELSHRFQTLTSFEEAAKFDSDALATIHLFDQYKSDLEEFISAQGNALEQARDNRSSLPFFQRLFASRSDEKSIAAGIDEAKNAIASVEEATTSLYELVDQTPSSKAEQKQMLSELRLLKKELTTEKRSVNESMRQIRTKARQDMATWTGVRGKGVVGSVARLERMNIRHTKEASLAPHEDAKARIERQIIQIERQINWVSRFEGTDPQEEESPLRCAYCGRRVPPSGICPGCGSDKTTRDL